MNSSKLEHILRGLGKSKIEKLYINLFKDIITVDIKAQDKDTINDFKVVFEEVFSFYFINEEGVLVQKPYIDSTNLNSIGYYKDGVGEFANAEAIDSELRDEDVSLPNFALDLPNSSMYIEAKSIKINDKKFKVGYPDI